jgi:hypothetical protein
MITVNVYFKSGLGMHFKTNSISELKSSIDTWKSEVYAEWMVNDKEDVPVNNYVLTNLTLDKQTLKPTMLEFQES